MTRKPKPKRKRATLACNCLELAQKALAEKGVRLKTELFMNFDKGTAKVDGPFLALEWIGKPKRGQRLPSMMPSYCPFCGKSKNHRAARRDARKSKGA